MRPSAAPSLSETDCLDALMRLRFGSAPCKACGGRSFERESRNRAFSCRSCGMKVFPCQGTPFARPRPPLTDWFRAVDLAARGETGARLLRRRFGLDRGAAAEMAATIVRLRSAVPPDPAAGWF